MLKTTQKELKELVKFKQAIDITDSHDRKDVPESYHQIGYASGVYGCNGMLLQGNETGRLYVIYSRTSAIWMY